MKQSGAWSKMADGTFAAADARKRDGFRSMAENNFYCLPMEPT